MKKNTPLFKWFWCLAGLAFLTGASRAWCGSVDGALRVELITAYNLVVDSNAGTPSSYAPRSAYMGVTFHNDGAVPLTDVIARIGDYKGGVGDTPGVYPTNIHAFLVGPLPGRAFALTHEGGLAGTADATRYISEIPAGGSVTIYWLVGYPQVDVNNVPTWGTSVKPEDDLWLQYDVWATALEGAATRQVDITRTVTMRNEISASANKIFPNGANKVPEYYKELMSQYVPSWTNAYSDGTVGTRIITEGIWYDLGNVGEGFDNNGDLVPDHNAWMQPVGDPSLFDPSAFRLVRTYAMVIVKLLNGSDLVLTGEDQLYFENIPENNGAVGYVLYEFMPMRAGAQSMTTPYQEVASGRDNEKFNADYGVSLGQPLISGEAKVLIDKTANVTNVAPGGTITYKVAYTNAGVTKVGEPTAGLPLVVQDAVPSGTVFVAGSASVSNTLPAGVSSYHVLYSADGGATWSTTQPVPASSVTHIQWWLDDPLLVGGAGSISFTVAVSNPYTQPAPLVENVAGLSLGNNTPFVSDKEVTPLTGVNRLGDTVYSDSGVGTGGYFGNGIQDGTEPGISNITVRLYADVNTNGVADSGEPLIGTAQTATNGYYLFGNLADGRYVAVVDARDSDLPFGYTLTTAGSFAADLDSAHGTTNAVSFLTADFGFAPALVLSKSRLGSGTLYEGQLVNYRLAVTNDLFGDGSGVAKPASYMVYPTNGTTGTGGNKVFQNATYLWHPGEPDGQYATAPFKDSSENVVLNSFSRSAVYGAITNVQLQIPMRVNGGTFPSGNILTVNVLNNSTQIGTTNIDCSVFSTGTFSMDVTRYLSAWNWTNFNGSALSVELISKKTANPTQTLDIDTVGFKVMTDQTFVGAGATTTLDPVPLNDFFDPTRLEFVSATITPDSVATNGTSGKLYWDNLGPIYAGGEVALNVTFKVLQPPNNTQAPLTNTASVTQAYFVGGTPANQDERKVIDNVLPAGMIGDFVWRDLNTNGVQNAGEPGIAGVTVQLLTNGVLLATTVTDASGYYLFEGLTNSASYTVTVVTSTLPGGSGTPTWDRDGIGTPNTATGVVINVTSTNGADTVLNADFGYNLLSAIRGTIWNDENRNGAAVPESGEERLGGVTVQLLAANGSTVLATTNTLANGTYLFVGPYVTNGTYFVNVLTNSGPLATNSWTQSYDTDSLTNANRVAILNLPLGGLGIADFSYYQVGAYGIGDTLFYDWNGNGVQDAVSDTGIANIPIWLYQDENTNGVIDAGVDALVAMTNTTASGYYCFTNLAPGVYQVIVNEGATNFPARYINTADPYGAKDGWSVVVLTNASNWVQDFGYQPYGFNAIGDTVWRDFNGDQVQSGASETGISNATVILYANLSGSGFVAVATNKTDGSGHYLFSGLPDGTYRVDVDAASAGIPRDSLNYLYHPTTATSYTVTVTNGMTYLSADYGFAPYGAIGDTVFWDANANGGQDWNEKGIPGVTVQLYYDSGLSNGVYDAGDFLIATNVTDSAGRYLFGGLIASNYLVRVDPLSSPITNAVLRADPQMDGQPCPYPPVSSNTCDGATGVIIQPGSSFMGADFGYQPLGVIGDLVWVDLNGNGVLDAGEQGIPYVGVALYSGATLVATNLTDADGYYLFSNLTNGSNYRVSVMTNNLPAGLVACFDADGTPDSVANSIVMSGGHIASINGGAVSNADLTIDFGYRYAGNNSLSGTVGMDDPTYDGLMNGSNPNGFGSGEYPFAGVNVYLYLWHDANTNGLIGTGETALIASTTTITNGDYSFANLPAGSAGDRYVVSLAAPAEDLRLTTVSHSDITVYNTTNAIGVTLSAYQVMPVTASRDNVDFAFKATKVLDYGDLPESYSTVVGDIPVGPSHSVVTNQNLWLGSGLSTEFNGKPTSDATGDSYDDGVAVVGRWQDGVSGGRVAVHVGAGSGWLEGWVDFNRDGTFTNENEHVVSLAVDSANGGNYSLAFDIPAGTFSSNDVTVLNARFRLYPSEPTVPTFFGAATGGEVEDYQFVFGLIGNFVWEDANGNGLQDAGEPGVSNVVVRLYDATNGLVRSETTAANGSYVFTGLQTNTYTVVFTKPANTLFTAQGVGDAQLNSDANVTSGSSGAVTLSPSAARLDVDAGLYVPAILYGYVFKDKNEDMLRDVDDAPITNTLVRLLLNGATVASTNTDASGYYYFANVQPGAVTLLVSKAGGTLTGVPGEAPASTDETRNRAVSDSPEGDAYISYSVTSGYGVLANNPAEQLNFGFVSYPLSTAIDFKVSADGRGGVLIDISTVNESGYGDIVVYAWIGNKWVEVGRVPASEVVGEGSNRYTIRSTALPPEGSYYFRIVDESGHVHDSSVPVAVTVLCVSELRFTMQTAVISFNTEYGSRYVVMVSDTPGAGADSWTTEYVSVLRDGVWSDYSNQPFMAGTEGQTQVRVPLNRQKAFFKIALIQE